MTQLLTLNDASDRLGISPDAVLTHVRAGRLRGINVGNGSRRPRWRITEDALEQFIAAATTGPAPQKTSKRKANAEVIEFFK